MRNLLCVAGATVMLALSLSGPTVSASAAPTSPSNTVSQEIPYAVGESYLTALTNLIEVNPAVQITIEQLLSEQIQMADAGSLVNFPGSDGLTSAQEAAVLTADEAAISTGTAGANTNSRGVIVAGHAQPDLSGNPRDWGQRGSAGNNNTTWSFQLAVALAYCDPGCVQTDRITISGQKQGPGPATTKYVSGGILYSPNSGNFYTGSNGSTHLHIQVYALCYASETVCGTENFDIPSSGSSTNFNSENPKPYNAKLKNAVALWAYIPGLSEWIGDGASTGTANCPGTAGGACIY